MSTHAAIFVQVEDGDWLRHYCHHDGYPEHMSGAIAKVDPQAILDAREIRGISPEGQVEAFEKPRSPDRQTRPAFPEWAQHAYVLTYPEGWKHVTDQSQLEQAIKA